MGPNEIDLVRVYTTEVQAAAPAPPAIIDETPLRGGGTTFDVVVEAEAGAARVDGAPYQVTIFARDWTTGGNPAALGTFTQVDAGALNAPGWGKYRHAFTVTIANFAAVDGHVMEYVAVLSAAAGVNRVHKFCVSEPFILTH
ncbi:hypothetical protein [Sphaerisporangium corydalis]|uniref:Uncharacterized protein n=1 Tax=Sphaerisporangium corydalis TaxID=1441875 RepID=A0ABV9ELE1_9ACTN|nr:hypothetical protein [Sphaerisporangium corydalis]